MTKETLLNTIFECKLNDKNILGLCIKEDTSKRLCFWVTRKSKKKANTYQVFNGDIFSGYTVEYSCLFKLSTSQRIKRLYNCSKDEVNEIIRLYSKLPKLSDLNFQKEELITKLKTMKGKEYKKLLKEYNNLCLEINKREGAHLQRDTNNSKYSMYKTTPTKGYISIVNGGKCSGK